MSKQEFSDECPGCRPAIIDVQTGKVMGPETPVMQCVNAVWAKTTREEREAFHRVCCLNSREVADMLVMKAISERIQAAAAAQAN